MVLKTPFQLGTLRCKSNIFYAPLAGCSDMPFRQMSNRYRPGLFFCEMVKMDALVRNDPGTYRLLDYTTDMHPIGAQLCGSKLQFAAQSARMIEELGFDALDFNCGCPVDKVTKDGSGSGMLKTPELIGDMISAMVAAVDIPVTVKIRMGWDENSLNAPLIAKIAEQAGAQAITIHGRTREQGYTGPANWNPIRLCKEATSKILIIGNGDLFDAPSAERMFCETGCDGVLVARGTMGQPWIVEDIERHLMGLPPIERTIDDVKLALHEHFGLILAYQNERQALVDMRRVGCWYLKRCEGVRALRQMLNGSSSTADVMAMLEKFAWEEASLASLEQFA